MVKLTCLGRFALFLWLTATFNKESTMVTVKKEVSLFWHFVLLVVLIELCGFLAQWLFGVLGDFLKSPMWHGVIGSVVYIILWIYAALFWLVCFLCQYVYIYGGVVMATFGVVETAKIRSGAKNEAIEPIIKFQARKLLKTYDNDKKSFGKNELRAFLNAVHLANLAKVSNKLMEYWISKCFSKNPDLGSLLSKISIEYIGDRKIPDLLLDKMMFSVH